MVADKAFCAYTLCFVLVAQLTTAPVEAEIPGRKNAAFHGVLYFEKSNCITDERGAGIFADGAEFAAVRAPTLALVVEGDVIGARDASGSVVARVGHARVACLAPVALEVRRTVASVRVGLVSFSSGQSVASAAV